MNETEQRISAFCKNLEEQFPAIKEITQALQEGRMDVPEAMLQLMKLVESGGIDPQAVEQIAINTFKETDIVIAPNNADGLPPPIFHGTRLPQGNPLVQASVAERLQFDGDVPEMRTGPLPVGCTPAVPVLTDARDPVAVGMLLQQASQEVQQALLETQEALIKPDGSNLPAVVTGVPGYEAGKKAEPLELAVPDGKTLIAIPEKDRQEYAWKALSTTQGRKSIQWTIEEMISTGLKAKGFDIETQQVSKGVPVLAYADWSTDLYGGQGNLQSDFNFIDIAAKAIQIKLENQMESMKEQALALEMTTINLVDTRRIGWAARIVKRGATK